MPTSPYPRLSAYMSTMFGAACAAGARLALCCASTEDGQATATIRQTASGQRFVDTMCFSGVCVARTLTCLVATRLLMRPVKKVMCAAAAILLSAGAAAQTPPNFSGKWILVPDPPAPAQQGARVGDGAAGNGWGTDLTVT